MIDQVEIWRLLAGLGIFLFGMFLMEESIKNLAGRSFKKFIRISTTGRIKSILSGAFITAILQSSSAVSLMVLAFVGAGIMEMANAIGVIVGSNVGTTFTAWIVALFGFKLDIESLSLPLIGIGGLGTIFLGKSARYSNISKLFAGFGFLFMGIDYMKDGVGDITSQLDISSLPDYGPFVYLLISVALTAIMQSSSAMIAIILTGLDAGILDFNAAAGMVIGANVGTTFTVLLGAIGAGPIKKRVAASHVFFNVFTAVIGFILLPLLVIAVQKILGSEESVMGVALFHTLFNVMGVLIFLPFTKLLARLLAKLIPERSTELTQYITNITEEVPDAAIESIRLEVIRLVKETMKYNLGVLNIDVNLVFTDPNNGKARLMISSKVNLDDQYQNLKLLQADIFTFAAKVQSKDIDNAEAADLNRILHAGRISLQSAKIIKDIKHNFVEFENADNDYLNEQYKSFRKRLIEMYFSVLHIFEEEEHENISNAIMKTLRRASVEDVTFIESTKDAINHKLVSDLNISTLLIVNRAFIQSSTQLVYCIRDLLLTDEEIKIFEGVSEVDSD